MSTFVDPKALVRTSFTDANQLVRTPRGLEPPKLAASSFAQTFNAVTQSGRVNSSTVLNPKVPSVAVQSGDTLTGIVKTFFSSSGQAITESQAIRLAQDVAKANGIANPNLIYPGQRINLSPLLGGAATASAGAAAVPAAAMAAAKPAGLAPGAGAGGSVPASTTAAMQALGRLDGQTYPVLQKTLDRAVEKGFIPAQDKQAVYDKIMTMSRDYKFSPDDFARLTLMESDGMNPRATNNRCHGIIQFCDGPDRGAATAGFASNPKAILNHSVLQQLDMVGKYFDQAGLRNAGAAGLDDLYLTVLTPAARAETRPTAGLNIAGPQSAYLHVNRDRKAPITRESIVQGLHQNANDRLGLDGGKRAEATNAEGAGQNTRAQALRVSAYLNPTYLR